MLERYSAKPSFSHTWSHLRSTILRLTGYQCSPVKADKVSKPLMGNLMSNHI